MSHYWSFLVNEEGWTLIRNIESGCLDEPEPWVECQTAHYPYDGNENPGCIRANPADCEGGNVARMYYEFSPPANNDYIIVNWRVIKHTPFLTDQVARLLLSVVYDDDSEESCLLINDVADEYDTSDGADSGWRTIEWTPANPDELLIKELHVVVDCGGLNHSSYYALIDDIQLGDRPEVPVASGYYEGTTNPGINLIGPVPFGVLVTPDALAISPLGLIAIGAGEPLVGGLIFVSGTGIQWGRPVDESIGSPFTQRITSLRWLPPCSPNIGIPTGGVSIPTNTGHVISIPPGQPGQVLVPGDEPGDPPHWADPTPSAHTHILEDITDAGALAALDTVSMAEMDSGEAEAGLILVTDGEGGYDLDDRTAYDPDAIHRSEGGEIAGLSEKEAPVAADVLVVEDSDDGWAKKFVALGNLPGGEGGGKERVWPASGELRDATGVDYATIANLLTYLNAEGGRKGYVGGGGWACQGLSLVGSYLMGVSRFMARLAATGVNSVLTLGDNAVVERQTLQLTFHGDGAVLIIGGTNVLVDGCRLEGWIESEGARILDGIQVGANCSGYIRNCTDGLGVATGTIFSIRFNGNGVLTIEGGVYANNIYLTATDTLYLRWPRLYGSIYQPGGAIVEGGYFDADGNPVWIGDTSLKLDGEGQLAGLDAETTPASGDLFLLEKSTGKLVKVAFDDMPAGEGGGGAVDSVFGRTGAVAAADDDYNAGQITVTPVGGVEATDVQAAIQELDTEKAAASHSHDIISAGDSSVKVVDTGTGAINLTVDGTKRADITAGGLALASGTRAAAIATANTASALAQRDASGDITARLFRPEYDAAAASFNFVNVQNARGAGADNYMRAASLAEFQARIGIRKVGVRVYNNASQNRSHTEALLFNSEYYDDAAFHNTGSNTSRLTVPTGYAGLYVIVGVINTVRGASDTYIQSGIQLNGSTYLNFNMSFRNLSGWGMNIAVTALEKLAVNDYVELRIFFDGGSTRACGVESHFEMFWLGPTV
jgi:hypothetical protein